MKEGLLSWGRHPMAPQIPHQPEWRDELVDNSVNLAISYGSVLPFGNGRSYGDSCLADSGHVVWMRQLSRFVSADWHTGVVVAEAGVLLEDVLELAIPNGWFLPVTPGTKFVTLGGAVANDVHGKNHHVRGTFGSHVSRVRLLRSDRPPVVCSAEEEPDLFSATIGGLGLTGVIEWVELQLLPIKSSAMDTTTLRFGTLGEFFELSAEFDRTSEYTVAWVDCLARGRSAGRGVFMAANHSEEGTLAVAPRRRVSIPASPPFSLMNAWSIRAFNFAYYHFHRPGRHLARLDYEPFFYPLDSILHWNRIYGPRGFQQYQCVIPEESAEAAVKELLRAIAASARGSFLAVLKKCGPQVSPGLLSFPLAGTSLALDFSQHVDLEASLFPKLDAIVRAAGGRLYPAKDAHMSGSDFRAGYPDWQRVEALRDPGLMSRFWKRVTER